ncbi:cholinesterase 2 isoform X2 [Plodia interpunctella]|nr:cholinesterase 2-like isoform X2 [Plodia interpunctella]XP_053614446.1 cholinesterase 2-like isoform X2 [Plodia interpunctella]XP_053614447.1 cholinesterase 2-like isoform X2 [Plodia interpunctella]XP_053614448.1 cholinesterase 2-like isoform X2 [Plodia interpunctella]
MKWVALLSLIFANVVQQPTPVLRTEAGLVRGSVSDDGRFYQYTGIPYARVDRRNRFQAPLPAPSWEGIFEASNENTWCPQTYRSVVIGDTDCLKLNVYTPVDARPGQLMPVMVFIHGGCFFEGSGSNFYYGGDFLVQHGVVYVGINYRLSVEGFLCLGIKEAPGNAGLKDQIAALKWIKRNIKAFGGDPDSVTLFGESAGAVSTSFLILSPAAKGLFHKAILQSGSSFAPWGLQHDPVDTASKLVKEFGFDTKDPYEIYSILSNKTASELVSAIKYSEKKNWITADILFVPCVEKTIPGVEPIVTKHPGRIIKSGNYTKIPMIIGYNDNEGIFFVSKDFGTSLKEIDVLSPLQPDLVFPNEVERNATADKIMKHYFSSDEEDKVMNMVDLYSDVHFKYPTVVESQLYAKTSEEKIYYYLFKYNGYMNMPKLISMFGGRGGASHADELFYIFRPRGFPLPHRYLENKMIKRMVTMWTNFAKYSDPTPSTSKLLPFRWQPSREQNPIALVIDRRLSTAPLWEPAPVAFWNETYKKYRRKGY